MSWTSSLFACLVPLASATDGRSARQIIGDTTDIAEHVFASSRNGALPANLKLVCSGSTHGQHLYLLGDEAVLFGSSLREQHDLLGRLLAEIERSASLVVEAMKEPFEPSGVLLSEGFHAVPFERVYPTNAVVKHGWIYAYTEAQILALMASAPCRPQPCPDGDDDGESLEFVFALLKSHRALLALAIERDVAIAFAEMSA